MHFRVGLWSRHFDLEYFLGKEPTNYLCIPGRLGGKEKGSLYKAYHF